MIHGDPRQKYEGVLNFGFWIWKSSQKMEIPLFKTKWKSLYCRYKISTDVLHGMNKNGCLYSGICATRSRLSSVVVIEGYDKLLSHPVNVWMGIF